MNGLKQPHMSVYHEKRKKERLVGSHGSQDDDSPTFSYVLFSLQTQLSRLVMVNSISSYEHSTSRRTSKKEHSLHHVGPEVRWYAARNWRRLLFSGEKARRLFLSKSHSWTYLFRQTRQLEDETLDAYHTRLRQTAAKCEFTNVDKEIKSQIILSCSSSRLRKMGPMKRHNDASTISSCRKSSRNSRYLLVSW